MIDRYAATHINVEKLPNPAAAGFVGFWAARPERFDQKRFPFSTDRLYVIDIGRDLPRFVYAGTGVRSDNGRDLTGQSLDVFDRTETTTRVLIDHMRGCAQRAEPLAWRVTANPCGRKYSYNKLYLPYPDMIVSASWIVDDPFETLPPRQREIIDLIAEGLQNKVIAYRLGIAESTVEGHLKAIMARLRVRNRTELATLVARHGLVRVFH